MKKVAIVTDSNSGISVEEGKKLGISVISMPFIIEDEILFEGVDLTEDKFYEIQKSGKKMSTSQPAIGDVMELWETLLKSHDEVLHLPMSSGLSMSCETAINFSKEYNGKVQVVDNKRISVTMRASVMDAIKIIKEGKSAAEAKAILEAKAGESSIYIVVDTLKYLKKGGRITPAAAAIGTLLGIKPILQLHDGKIDSFAKVMSVSKAKEKILEAIKKDVEGRFAPLAEAGKLRLAVAHTQNTEEANKLAEEVKTLWPNIEFTYTDALSLSVATHTGPKVLAVGVYGAY